MPDDLITKRCSGCDERKLITDFYPRMNRCKVCHKLKTQEWAKNNPDKVIAARNKWRSKPGSREKEIIAAVRWQKEHPEQFKRNNLKSQLKKLYGITIEQFEEMERVQDGKCAICQKVPDRRLDVDHNHITGQVRKLLCTNCNTGVGLFQEDPQLLKQAMDYLVSFT